MTRYDAIKHLSYKIAYCKSVGENWADAVNVDALEIAVRELAKPERKISEWEMDKEGNCYCFQCGLHYDSWAISGFKYCPNCGSEMREEE